MDLVADAGLTTINDDKDVQIFIPRQVHCQTLRGNKNRLNQVFKFNNFNKSHALKMLSSLNKSHQ